LAETWKSSSSSTRATLRTVDVLRKSKDWLRRRRAHRRLNDRVGLWYHPQYRIEGMGETARVPGVDVARGEKILGSLAAERLIRPEDVHPAALATLADLAAVHSDAYLARTAEAAHLGHIFGLEEHDVDVDPILV
jgi:hypothetical protein